MFVYLCWHDVLWSDDTREFGCDPLGRGRPDLGLYLAGLNTRFVAIAASMCLVVEAYLGSTKVRCEE